MVLDLIHLNTVTEITTFLKHHNLIFMYGPTCKPCQWVKPQLFDALTLLPNTITLGLVDAQAHRDLRTMYNVDRIPYLIVFDGSAIKTSIQSSDMAEIRPFLAKHLNLSFPDTTDFNCDAAF